MGKGFTWTEEEEDALLKGVDKYGRVWKRIKEDNDKVLADRTPQALKERLRVKFPEKYKAARAATTHRHNTTRKKEKGILWTEEEEAALKTGVEVHGRGWEKIISKNELLRRRTPLALSRRYHKHLNHC
ncbi:hypothetical protein TrST_g3578 [Triparma strigata]|uniref:Uncharacterized protein n=1 Tax=Triparma strigata TaxID=1606541 RepID=A0A9W7EIZ4_9STRA|nr:hypothetical protein TrST_g3578 [Triparma strigata]